MHKFRDIAGNSTIDKKIYGPEHYFRLTVVIGAIFFIALSVTGYGLFVNDTFDRVPQEFLFVFLIIIFFLFYFPLRFRNRTTIDLDLDREQVLDRVMRTLKKERIPHRIETKMKKTRIRIGDGTNTVTVAGHPFFDNNTSIEIHHPRPYKVKGVDLRDLIGGSFD